jgi:excisionase family DNA binding protein
MTDDKPQTTDRLKHIIDAMEAKRAERMEQVKAKTGRTDLPLDKRKLTGQEAAAFCGVSATTISRWAKAGLRSVAYGQRRRYMVADLMEYMRRNGLTR